jgi:hypothetical protein
MNFQQDEDETIELAIHGIEKSINWIVQHRSVDKKGQRQIQKLVHHTSHLLKELFAKRRSLRAFIEWFREEWNHLKSKIAQNPLAILQHAMENFIRMSDGLVLLTSGECRHPFDIQNAQTTKFPSKLSTLKERQDGYTCLYKADAIYSGFGWDEFCNESVGIQARLVALLGRYIKSPWDYLERKGKTQLLESLLDQQELAVKELQQQVQDLKKVMMTDIKLELRPKKASFVTQDKMERLVIATEKQTICLERRADNFRIKQRSILPNDYTRSRDWKILSLRLENKTITNAEAANGKRKRRLVIEDSDSDDDGAAIEKKSKKILDTRNATDAIQQTTGLVVRIETSISKTETEDSLIAIKTQMGVDVKGLEASREELEKENNQEKGTTECQEDKTNKLKRILERVLSRQDVDDNEVWDARECLRQSYMELGNELLFYRRNYEKALESFQHAKKLVKQQEVSHHRTARNANDDTFESRYIYRNLLFLSGRATVNVGITLVEWARNEKKGIAKRKASQAITELRSVEKLASEMRRQAETDKHQARVHSSEWREAMVDSLRSDQLESLACRWMGLSLWLSFQEKEAISVLEHASSFFVSNRKPRSELIPPMLELAAECIYATCTLMDLACSKMEQLPRSENDKGDEYLTKVKGSLQRYAEIVGRLEQIVSLDQSWSTMVQVFQQDNEISSSKLVLENLAEIQGWWQTKKMKLSAKTSIAPRLSSILPRLDLFPGGAMNKSPEPTAHIMLSEGRRRKQKQAGGNFRSQDLSSSNNAVYALASDESKGRKLPLRFRKWGDDLLYNRAETDDSRRNKDGDAFDTIKKKAVLVYPSIAPPLPAEFSHLVGFH